MIFSILFCLVAYLRQPTEIVGYFLCTICMLIALMDVDSYEIDLRLLLVLTMVGFSIRLDAVEGVILSMVAGSHFIHHGLWSWQTDLARGSFRHGRCLFF